MSTTSAIDISNSAGPRATLVQVLDRSWKVDAMGILLVGLLSLGGYYAGLGPYLGAKLDKARHDMALADARRERDDAKADAENFERQLAEKREQTKSVEVKLESVQERHIRVGAISRLAADSNLMLDQVSPGNAEVIEDAKAVVRVPINLGGKGSYADVSEFLRRLHEQFRDTSVASVKLLAEPGTNGEVAVFSVTLQWFAKPDMPTGNSGGTAQVPE